MKCEDRFACLIHRFDRFLVPLRGDDGAEVKARVDDYLYASRYYYSTNVGNKPVGLRSSGADADVVGLASDTLVADIDIITARGELYAGENTLIQCCCRRWC